MPEHLISGMKLLRALSSAMMTSNAPEDGCPIELNSTGGGYGTEPQPNHKDKDMQYE